MCAAKTCNNNKNNNLRCQRNDQGSEGRNRIASSEFAFSRCFALFCFILNDDT